MSPDLAEVVLLCAAVAVVTIDLSLGVVRGRFGTVQRRANLELVELSGSREVPGSALRRARAVCRGHTGDLPAVLGTGVLWLEPERLGFLVRRPRRRMEIELTAVRRAYAAWTYHRPGFRPVRAKTPMLVVEWSTPRGSTKVAWRVNDAVRWARDINARRETAEIIAPGAATVRVA
jgi:hypothetical protein